jgi:RHS repeat-associated protein
VVLETTKTGAVAADQRYYAYGRRLDTSGHISGERDYTGQRLDATGLLYYNARYYDPQLGQFVSPDTLVPEPTSFLDYNRYLYAKGNPLKYSDPSGHCAVSAVAGPVGLAVDIPCWASGVGETLAAGAAAVTVMAMPLAALLVLTPDDSLPNYPAPTTTGDFNTVGASFPLPGATTVAINDGVPLGQLTETGIVGEQAYDPSDTSILADPLASDTIGNNVYSASTLRRNLIKAGQVPLPGEQAHHIVAAGDPRAADARAILSAAGIGINSPANGIFLPGNTKSPNPTGATIHSTVHTDKYYVAVQGRLSTAAQQGSVVLELENIRHELENGTFPH